MLTVETDVESVEARLRSGGLVCPECGGVLVPWGFGRVRWLRTGEPRGRLRLHPRRARCVGCARTHVLLPVVALARRADVAVVIGAGLEAKAAGGGHRRIARALGRPAATVRGWLRRFASRAEPVRVVFTSLAVWVDPDSVPTVPGSSPLADAVVAVAAAASAVGRRWGGRLLALSVWQVAAALTHGRLLSPVLPVELTNTSRLWAGV